MSEKICELSIVMTDEGDHTGADIEGSFVGNKLDVCKLIMHILYALDLNTKQAIGVCEATKLLLELKMQEEEDETCE